MKKLVNQLQSQACPDFNITQQFEEEINIQTEFRENWNTIQQFIEQLYQNEQQIPQNISCHEVYGSIVDLCQLDQSQQLHNELQQLYNKYFENILTSLNEQQSNEAKMQEENSKELDQDFLNKVEKIWSQIRQSIIILSQVLKYFETTYLFKTRTSTLEQFIIFHFATQFNKFPKIKQLTSQNILNLISNRRNGIQINDRQLKRLTEMFIALELYESELEGEFLKESEIYFTNVNQQLIQYADQLEEQQIVEKNSKIDEENSNSIDVNENNKNKFDFQKFLPKVQSIINSENELVNNFLNNSSTKKIEQIYQKKLILNNFELIFENFGTLLRRNDFENLKILYKFILQVDKIEWMKKSWRFCIKEQGMEIINIEDRNLITEKLLTFIKNLDLIMRDCFQNDKGMQNMQKYAIEDVLNQKVNQLAELTCKHIDNKLTKKNKSMQEEELIKNQVEEALQLFRYLPSKDVFEEFFNKRLIKRIILDMSYSQELEEYVISKLKEECGETYTAKSEDIVQDIKSSKEHNKDFEQFAIQNEKHEISQKLYVNLISSKSWPHETISIQKLYSPLLEQKQLFEEYYKGKQSSAQLYWQYNLSTVEVYAYYNKKKYTFIMSMEQALVLLLFNDQDELSMEEIGSKLGIEKEILKLTLVSLCFLKDHQKVLTKINGPEKVIQESDRFVINKEYKSQKLRNKFNSVQLKETKEQIDKVIEKVIHDRQYVIDASIVKIMKLKKVLTHQQLSQEIFLDLKLPLQKIEIKKRIETLIDRDYLTRDEQDKTLYHYQA